jgi:putative ABC transport system permease protein
MPGGATDGALTEIAAVAGVAAAEPLAHLAVTIDRDGERYATTLAAFPAGTTMHGFLTADGTRPLPPDGLLVGVALRDTIGLAAGDEVTLVLGEGTGTVEVDARIAGLVEEPFGTYAYGSREVVGALVGPDALEAATRSANVRFEPGADPAATIDRLEEVEGVAAVADARSLARAAESLMGLFYAFVGVMLVLGAVMAFALLFNLMAANISERVTELASLRAAGMSGGELSRVITAENVLLTLAGIVPGLVVGYVAAAEFMASFSSDLFTFELAVRPTTFLFTALGVLAAALVSQVPILRAVRRIDIAAVVRERAQ